MKLEDRSAPIAVLLAAIASCAAVLWIGPRLVGWLLSKVADTSPPVDESIASITIFGLLLFAGLAGARLSGMHGSPLGPRAGARLARGTLIGLAGLFLSATFGAIAGVLRPGAGNASAALLLWGTALIVLQAGSEEIFFRGWLQPVLTRSWGGAGIVVTAIAFAALHMLGPTRSLISVANLFLGGLLFGLLANRYQGLAAPIGAHFAWNWAEQLLLGLDPNPGVGSFGSIWDADLVGSNWWGGSAEGLNASVAMTFALAILLTPLLIVPATGRPERAPSRSGPAPA